MVDFDLTGISKCCCSSSHSGCDNCSSGCGTSTWTWHDTGGGEGYWELTSNDCSCGWPVEPTTHDDRATQTTCCTEYPCNPCPTFIPTLYITYSCSPGCSCQNGTFPLTFSGANGGGAWVWAATSNPCECDDVDVLLCKEGAWYFSSCFGSGYNSPPGITVTVVSMNPLQLELSGWTHQGTGDCIADVSTCTATISE